MHRFPTSESVRDLILLAKAEDLGSGDVTSRLMIREDAQGVGTLYQKQVGVVAGLPLVAMICGIYDERLRVEQVPGFHMDVIEGRFSESRQTPLLRVRGPVRSLLAAERIILNFLQRLSGVATVTQRFVKRVEGTSAKIYDTRKTTPGMRLLEKYAVLCGGGYNHRIGLHDGVLAKDNHLAGIEVRDLARAASRVAAASRAEDPARMIEFEVTSLEQFEQLVRVGGINLILLDNMDCPTMQRAVELRDKAGAKGKLELEASGGVTLETVRSVALTGVDRIAVGALTHSAPALDISLEIEV